MIFRLSQKLNAKIKAGTLETLSLHENPLLDWSAHQFSVGRRQFILISNTKSFLSMILPGKGITSEASFKERALSVLGECLEFHGYDSLFRRVIAPASESFRFGKALNRSVLGSMNELIHDAKFIISEGTLTRFEISHRLNDTLLSVLLGGESHGYGKPREAFQVMVNEAESKTDHS